MLIFDKQFLRPCQIGACGTSRACHTLDTPLEGCNTNLKKYKLTVLFWIWVCSKNARWVDLENGIVE